MDLNRPSPSSAELLQEYGKASDKALCWNSTQWKRPGGSASSNTISLKAVISILIQNMDTATHYDEGCFIESHCLDFYYSFTFNWLCCELLKCIVSALWMISRRYFSMLLPESFSFFSPCFNTVLWCLCYHGFWKWGTFVIFFFPRLLRSPCFTFLVLCWSVSAIVHRIGKHWHHYNSRTVPMNF